MYKNAVMVESFIRGYIFFAGEKGREGPEIFSMIYYVNLINFNFPKEEDV